MGVVIFSIALAGVSHGRNPKDATAPRSATYPTPVGALLASNLQVLPRDTSYADLVLLMTRYSQDLGVQCVFCHTQNPQTEQVDFASDESPAKLTARIMIGMLRDINGKYLAQVSDRRYAVPITCGNCHQGRTFPPVFEPKLSP
jgi:hypothetical protein